MFFRQNTLKWNKITQFAVERWIRSTFNYFNELTTGSIQYSDKYAWITIYPSQEEYFRGKEEIAKIIFRVDGWELIYNIRPDLNDRQLWTKEDLNILTNKNLY